MHIHIYIYIYRERERDINIHAYIAIQDGSKGWSVSVTWPPVVVPGPNSLR